MFQIPTLGDVMTRNPIGVEPNCSLAKACETMLQHDIHHLVVLDGLGTDANPDSIISLTDIQRFIQLGSKIELESELTVSDIDSGKVYIADVNDPLTLALQAMVNSHGGTIVALNDGALAGILTPSDACRLFSTFLENALTPAN